MKKHIANIITGSRNVLNIALVFIAKKKLISTARDFTLKQTEINKLNEVTL